DIAYTLQVGRKSMEKRIAFIASNRNELINQLRISLEGLTNSIELEQTIVPRLGQTNLDYSNLNEIASHWLDGGNISWNKLYDQVQPNKISLPTYPFQGNRHWFEKSNKTLKSNDNQTVHPRTTIDLKEGIISYLQQVINEITKTS